MTKRLPDRIALVTGGTGQLGRHVVRACLAEGARVHVPVFDPGEGALLKEEMAEVGASARVTLHGDGDLTDPERVRAIFREVEAADGRGPDVLLNLAGGFAMASVEDTDPAMWDRLWRINATTAFLCSREALPGMKERGWGRIVNVSAVPVVERGESGLSAYGAAKAAVLNLTHTLAREAVDHGVTVNAIVPSIIDTPENREAMPDADTATWLPPEEIAGVVTFLASEEARVVNGAVLTLTLG